MWFKSQGTLQYYSYGNWWVILNCCEGLVSYYRMLAERYSNQKLQKPKHGAHISVIRGEGEPKNKSAWGWNDGGLVDFEYNLEVVFGETHAWLEVRSDELVKLRKNLGLTERPEFGFHLTLGRTK